jgi:hypothetical protein
MKPLLAWFEDAPPFSEKTYYNTSGYGSSFQKAERNPLFGHKVADYLRMERVSCQAQQIHMKGSSVSVERKLPYRQGGNYGRRNKATS